MLLKPISMRASAVVVGVLAGLAVLVTGCLPAVAVSPQVAITSSAWGGWWTSNAAGQVTTGLNAPYSGGVSVSLNRPIVGMTTTPDGKGYWLVASDGGIFSFGNAAFYGSTGAVRLNRPIVGIAATPDGKGYWMVASDGGIFSFGDARFYGSTGAVPLNRPIVAMLASSAGRGYLLVAADGGVFTFGDAPYFGSTAGRSPAPDIVGISRWGDGSAGYALVDSIGVAYNFGASNRADVRTNGQRVVAVDGATGITLLSSGAVDSTGTLIWADETPVGPPPMAPGYNPVVT